MCYDCAILTPQPGFSPSSCCSLLNPTLVPGHSSCGGSEPGAAAQHGYSMGTQHGYQPHSRGTTEEVLLRTPAGVPIPSLNPCMQTSASNCQTCPFGFDFPGCHGNVTTENAASAGNSCLHSLSGGHLSYTWIGRTAERSSYVKRYLGPQRLTVHGACWKCKLIPLGRVPIGSFLHPAIRSFPGAIQIQFASHNTLDMSRAKGNVPGREHNSKWRGWHRDLWVEGHRKATSSTGVSHLFSKQGKWLMRSAFGA